MSAFNEDSRVKIPALLHLARLGYHYLSLKGAEWDRRNNIFTGIFDSAITRINPGIERGDVRRLLDDIHLDLQNEDLGKAFHTRLTARSGLRLVDFDNLDNNSLHVVTELPFESGEDQFRPDIVLLVNGSPLAMIDVKKRMNTGGILEERHRMDRRHANPKFRHFFNLTQLLVFSNNMEYDDGMAEPVQGAFYATSTYGAAHFNHFREELPGRAEHLRQLNHSAGEQLFKLFMHYGFDLNEHPLAGAEIRAWEASPVFANTRDRSLLGSLNRFKDKAWMHFAHRNRSLPEAAAGQWEGFFRHPSFAQPGRRYGDHDWQRPLDLVRARLQAVPAASGPKRVHAPPGCSTVSP